MDLLYIYIYIYNFVVVCTELSSSEPHIQVGVGIVVTSRSLHGVVVEHWAECQRCGFGYCSRHNISRFHLTHDRGCCDQDPVQATCCMVVECTLLCICGAIACRSEI